MIVYQLTSYSVNSTEMYPLELYEKDNLQLFSTIALALENMNQQIAEKMKSILISFLESLPLE